MAVLAASSLAGLTNSSLAQSPDGEVKANDEQIDHLIRDLGSKRFAAREAASDQLARIGLPALAALEEASRHTDREIRFRAEYVLILVRNNDLERRLAAFIAGRTGDDEGLPAWPRFSELYGDTETSRKLFVAMQRAEPELLSALDRDPPTAVEFLGRSLGERVVNAGRGVNVAPAALSPGAVSAFLFVAGQEDSPVSANSMYLLLQLCRQPLGELQRAAKEFELAKQMLGGVIRRCDGEATLPAISLAHEFQLADGLIPALRFLEQHDKLNPASAITLMAPLAYVAELGDKTHVPAVEKLLENQTLIGSGSQRVIENGQGVMRKKEMQVRDAALTTLIKLTGQNMTEYYGQELPRSASRSPYQSFPPAIVGFESEEQRTAVFQKWAAFRMSQTKPMTAAETKQPAR